MNPVIFVAIVGFGSLPSRVLLPLLAEIIAEHTSTVTFVIKAIVDKASDRLEAAREGLEKTGLLHAQSVQYLNDLEDLNLLKLCREAASIGGSVLIFDCSPTAIHLDHCIYYLSLIKGQELNNLYVLIEKPLFSASPAPEQLRRLNDLLQSMEEQRVFVNACELFSPVMATLFAELRATAQPTALVEFKAYRKNSIGLSAFLDSDFTRLGPLLGSTVCQDKGWHDLINLLACLWVTLDSPAQQLKDAKWQVTENKRVIQPHPGKKEAFVSAVEPSFTSDPRLAASAQSQLIGWVQIAEQKTTTLHLESDWIFAGDNFACDLERQLDHQLVSERLIIAAQIPYYYRDFRFAEATFAMDHTELAFRMSFLSNLNDGVIPFLSRLNHSGRWEKIQLIGGDLRGGMKDSYKSVINRILGKENGQFPEHLPLELILKAEQVLIKAFHDSPPPEVSDSKLRLRECVKKALSGPD